MRLRSTPRLLRSMIAAAALLCASGRADARPPSDLQRLRDYYEGRGDREKLRGSFLKRYSVARMLQLLVHVEHLDPRPAGLQRFETPEGAYVVLPPRGYTPKRPWPLHIELHGHGPGQTGPAACGWWKGTTVKAGVILACPDLRGHWTTAKGEALLLATYRDVQQRFNVHTDRVSLGGFSGGGIGTWIFGPRYPDLFNALVPRAGIPPRAEDVIRNLNGLPIFLIHGKNDGTIPVSHSRRVLELLDEVQIPHVYRELPGGHEPFSQLDGEVLKWLARQKRHVRSRFRYHGPIVGQRRIVHWLELEGSGTVTVEGRIDRRRRAVITIDHPESVKRLTVWLSRRMFDMGARHVDVIVNGRAFGFPVRESVAAVLDSYDVTRDLRRVYTARVTVEGSRLR